MMLCKVQLRDSVSGHQRAASSALLSAILLVLPFIATRFVEAQTLDVLYTFTGGRDGANPQAGMIRDASGNLYGVTQSGGAFGYGTVFKLDPKGKETVMHSFAAGDGMFPEAGLIRDSAGNFYGTTYDGGTPEGGGCKHGCGTVFKLDKTGKETVLYAFTGGPDGGNPQAALIQDAGGNLFGTTVYGGDLSCYSPLGCGVVFKVDKAGKQTVLHTFIGGSDGESPSGGLLMDKLRDLYGTTIWGGDSSCNGGLACGEVFKLDSNGQETALYRFTGPPDGESPAGVLVRDKAGNLYGATGSGGILSENSCRDYNGCGTVFKVDQNGKETVLYRFTGGSDGRAPFGGIIKDRQGNLYGTTTSGGSTAGSCRDQGGCGVVFKLDTTGKQTVLHSFTKGKDGAFPRSGLIRDTAGNLYGIAEGGGSGACAGGCGVVFRITP
jgi:uncharacterized repeat protein (TIGR03803 family)